METNSVNTPPVASPSARPQLSPEQWLDAATELLATEGINGLRVEVLAKHCGVTKGSFYWHFKDRRALLDGVLRNWKQGRINDIDKAIQGTEGSELDRLEHLIERYSARKNQKGMAIELAMRDWAQRDEEAARTVAEVDLHRLESTYQLFRATGLPDSEAKSRSLLLYACVFGLSLMHYEHFDEDLNAVRAGITRHILARTV
jgi:AcrR family transcriptional regulator